MGRTDVVVFNITPNKTNARFLEREWFALYVFIYDISTNIALYTFTQHYNHFNNIINFLVIEGLLEYF